MNPYFYIGAYITQLCQYNNVRIGYIVAKQLPDDGFVIEYNSILMSFVYEPYRDCFLPHSDDDCSDTEADCYNECIDPEQSPFWTRIYGTSHWDNCRAGMPISNEYFDVFTDDMNLWSLFSCAE